MGIEESPNRVVRTKDSVIAFVGHDIQTNEDILIELKVDSASNKVSFTSMSKARKGIDYVEANEDVQALSDQTNKLIDQQVEAGVALPGVTPGHTVFNPGHVVNEPPEEWEKLKFATKAEWKAWVKAGKPAR